MPHVVPQLTEHGRGSSTHRPPLVSPTPAATTASVPLAPALMDSQNRRFSSRFGKRMQRLLTGWLLQRLPELKAENSAPFEPTGRNQLRRWALFALPAAGAVAVVDPGGRLRLRHRAGRRLAGPRRARPGAGQELKRSWR